MSLLSMVAGMGSLALLLEMLISLICEIPAFVAAAYACWFVVRWVLVVGMGGVSLVSDIIGIPGIVPGK